MDLGVIAFVGLLAGLAGGALGAAIVGTVEGMLRQRYARSWSYAGGDVLTAVRPAAPEVRFPGAEPFDDFNDRARRVLAFSQDEATRLHHDYIGTEHMLVALVREAEGVAARTLNSLGVELEQVRTAVRSLIQGGGGTERPGGERYGVLLAPETKNTIRFAREEAHKLGHSYVGTEHLLLGLVRENGVAMKVLQSLGVMPDRARHEIIATMGQQAPGASVDPLDPSAHQVLALARDEARRSGHGYLGTEHLALALRGYESPVLVRVWSELALAPEALRQRIEAAVPPTPGVVPTQFPPTPRIMTIIGIAQALATERRRLQASPEHLLLALVAEGGGVGAQALVSLGATGERIREIVDRTQA